MKRGAGREGDGEQPRPLRVREEEAGPTADGDGNSLDDTTARITNLLQGIDRETLLDSPQDGQWMIELCVTWLFSCPYEERG